MPVASLQQYLDALGVSYDCVQHSVAFTAPEVAESAHIPGRDFAKTVIVKIEDEMAMVVLPANRRLNLTELRELLDTDKVELASEAEFKSRFPDCELGAMPPFGNLYGLPVYLETSLAHHDEIAFNAGSHREVMRMRTHDFTRLVNPVVLDMMTA